MSNLRALADSKIQAAPEINPELYLRDQIEKNWPVGKPFMKLRDLTEQDFNKDLVGKLRLEGREKLEAYLKDDKNKTGVMNEARVIKGYGKHPSVLFSTRKYTFWDQALEVAETDQDAEKIRVEDFNNDLLVGVLIAAVRGGLIVNCEIDIEPHTHIWRQADGASGTFAEKLRSIDQHVPVTGRIILK